MDYKKMAEEVTPIAAELRAKAAEFHKLIGEDDTVALLEKAADELVNSTATAMVLLKKVIDMELAAMLRDLVRGNQAPAPRVMGIDRDGYLEFCRAAINRDQTGEVKTALRAANEAFEVSKVVSLTGVQIVPHMQKMESLRPGWVNSIGEFLSANQKGG